MKNTITQSHIDGYCIASGQSTARPRREPSLLYVTAVRFFRASVALGLLAGTGACVVKFITSFTR